MRVGRPANTLGARRDGPMHTSNHRLWCATRRRGWRGAVPDVQQSDSMPNHAEIPQLGPRSPVSVLPMAGESANPRGERNQDGALRTALASLRLTVDWNDSARIS